MARIALVCVSLMIGLFTASAQPLPLPELPDIPYYVPPEYAVDARASSYFVTTTADEDDGICGGGTGISLREAVVYCAQVATPAVLYIPNGIYTLTSEIAVTDKSVRLIGESRDGTIITTAANDHRHLNVDLDFDDFGVFGVSLVGGTSDSGGSIHLVGRFAAVVIYDVYFTLNSASSGASVWMDAYDPTARLIATFDRVEIDQAVAPSGAAVEMIASNDASSMQFWNSAIRSSTSGGVRVLAPDRQFSVYVEGSVFDGLVSELPALLVNATDLVVVRNVFKNNTSTFYGGGAIHVSGGGVHRSRIVIDASHFVANSAPIGGALLGNLESSDVIAVTHSIFDSNVSDGSGGAIWLLGNSASVLSIESTTFTDNTAKPSPIGAGGALWALAGNITVSESLFTGNQSSNCGGARLSVGGNLIVTFSEFNQNRAFNIGGGLCVESWKGALIQDTEIVGNLAESDDGLSGVAGGLYISLSDAFAVRTRIEQNDAAHVGSDCYGASLISLGGNAITDTSGCNYVAHPTDRIDNLLDNGGFEFAAGDPAVPDAWTAKNLTGDKRKCNTSAKTFTDYGRCALVFRGGPGESAQFAQDVDLLTHTFSAGELLELYAMGWGGPAGSVVVQAKATYADPLLAATKAKLVLQGSEVAVEDVNAFALAGGDLTQLTVKVKHKSPSGKMTVDRVYLTRSLAAPRGPEFGLLPPPAAPDGFRGGN